MVANLTFRTVDNTRWGGGLGSDLSAQQVDLNFWNLFTAVQALEDHQDSVGAGIDFINQPNGGNQFFIHLTDHRVLGPFIIPTAQWNPRGDWQPHTSYAAYDVVSNNAALYLITIPHTSGDTFSPFATDGLGHNLYNLLLQNPADMIPLGGEPGQKLIKAAGSGLATEWADDRIRIHRFVEGGPDDNELLIQYTVTDNMVLPQGLVNSVIFQEIPSQTEVIYTLLRNGAAIGTITFTGPSPISVVVVFGADVNFVPGDILTMLGPTVADSNQANISFTLVATLLPN